VRGDAGLGPALLVQFLDGGRLGGFGRRRWRSGELEGFGPRGLGGTHLACSNSRAEGLGEAGGYGLGGLGRGEAEGALELAVVGEEAAEGAPESGASGEGEKDVFGDDGVACTAAAFVAEAVGDAVGADDESAEASDDCGADGGRGPEGLFHSDWAGDASVYRARGIRAWRFPGGKGESPYAAPGAQRSSSTHADWSGSAPAGWGLSRRCRGYRL